MKILITGTPGTGKTTIAKALSVLLHCPVISLKGRGTEIDVHTLKKELMKKLKSTERLILEGHLLCDLSLPMDIVFVLRTDPDVLKERLREKQYVGRKFQENLLCEYLDYCTVTAKLNYKNIYDVDTTNKKPEDVAMRMVGIMKKGHGDNVDWSKKLKKHLIKQLRDRNLLMSMYNKMLSYFGKQNWWPTKEEGRYEIIVGALLTQNTSWKNVEKALENLRKERLLAPGRLLAIKTRKLEKLIRPAGFFKRKANVLKKLTKIFLEIERKKQPDTEWMRRMLLSISGIGKETADSILLYAYGREVFVIDNYTKRILKRHGIKMSGYDELREFFESSLSLESDLFGEYHALLVATGKNYCKKTKPLCALCPLRAFKIGKR